jgi:microcin C transport system permease protein
VIFSKKLDPITVKRLKRFRQIKRAYWSLWVLLLLYILSLCSELLCNNKPLYIAFEGKSYFPILKYYPESEFTDSDTLTRPDYKKIASSSRFTNDPRNWMFFAPVPYGPQEILDSESLDIQEEVTIVLVPKLQIGTINIRRDFIISKSARCGYNIEVDYQAVKSMKITD